MKCGSCGKQIDDEFILCPFCGADVGGEAPDETLAHPVHPDVYPLLAQANLLRTRGDVAGARDKCTEALRRRPNDFDAQMMLAELCEQAGDHKDALSWYEMAYAVRPADALKARIDALRARRAEGADDADAAVEASPAAAAPRAYSRVRAATYIAAAVLVFVAIIVIPIAAVLRGFGRSEPGSQPASMPRAANTAARAPSTSDPLATNVPSGTSPTGQPPSVTPQLGGFTAREQALARTIQQTVASDGVFQVAVVALDPRDGSATVRLAASLHDDQAAERGRVIRAASRAAGVVLSREPACMTVTIQVAVHGPEEPQASVGFVGVMHRGQQDFADIWYGPALGGG